MRHDDITAIVEAYSDMVMRIAYQHCFNKSDSEDITQEAFMKLMDHLPELENETAIKAWLIRVTVGKPVQGLEQKRLVPTDNAVGRM